MILVVVRLEDIRYGPCLFKLVVVGHICLHVAVSYVRVALGILVRHGVYIVVVACAVVGVGQGHSCQIVGYERFGIARQTVVGLVVDFFYYRKIEAYGPQGNAYGL